MRWVGRAVPILAAAVALAVTPASAMAATATTYSDSIHGLEYTATFDTGPLRRHRAGRFARRLVGNRGPHPAGHPCQGHRR